MPTEQQLVETIRAHAADDTETLGREIDIATNVLGGVRSGRRRRRRRVVAGSAVAVALVSVVSYAGIHAVVNTSATPPADQDTDNNASVGHTVLPADVLDLRGKAVGDALGLPPVDDSSADCSGTIAAYTPLDGFCVDIGNAPDDWLVTELIMGSNRTSGLLRSVGIPWESDRPAPPPVVVGLLEAKIATLADTYGQQSPEVGRANVNLDLARALWRDQAGWEAAGWNDHYWGDPWWPTTSDNGAAQFGRSILTPDQVSLRGRALAKSLGLVDYGTGPSPSCTDEPDGAFVEVPGDHSYCVELGNAPDNWLAGGLVWDQWDSGERMLEQVGIPWDAELPPPPPVVVDLLRAHLEQLDPDQADQGPEYATSLLELQTARDHWAEQRPAWEAAGWNDHYWGDPWWPTSD
jgi:hypothetical protein